MKILITGSNGQLGSELQKIISQGKAEIGQISKEIKNSTVIPMDIDNLDISNLNEVKKAIKEIRPDVIINCAAATNVDGCESNKDLAFKVNALGPRNLAIASEEIGAKIVQVSTDYAFSGVGESPLTEYELTAPYSVYGKTKLLGENYVKDFSSKYYIVRTSWLYGYTGKNFVYTMLKLGSTMEELKVVNDQLGNPTNANDLAYHIIKLIESEEYGIYHCTGNGQCSWFDFATEIIKLGNKNCEVKPCTSNEYKEMYPKSAKRPEYSSLDNAMLRATVGDEMRHWKDGLKVFIENIEE